MPTKWLKHNTGIIAAWILLLSGFMAIPACYAGGAVTIVPDKNQLAPKGSYIPDRRVKKVLKKIEEQKAMLDENKKLQQEEQPQKNTLPKPQSSNKD